MRKDAVLRSSDQAARPGPVGAAGEVREDEGRWLTVPDDVGDDDAGVLCTGNEWVSLPVIRPADAGVERLGALHLGTVSLVELAGTPEAPLLRPWLSLEGDRVELAGRLRWRLLEEWIPAFTADLPERGLRLAGRLVTPPGHKGFVVDLRVARSGGGGEATVSLGVEGWWYRSHQTVYTSRPVPGHHAVRFDRWCSGPVLEARPGVALLALALALPGGTTGWDLAEPGERRPAEDTPELQWWGVGRALYYRIGREFRLARGGEAQVAVYGGVNREGDGARTTAVDLLRRGADVLAEQALGWLSARPVPLRDATLASLARRNLYFNHFYATGRAIDTEDLVLVTSRSPRYYVSAAFWARDALLWSFPALLLVDRALAREALVTAFSRYGRNPGIHSLYVDGSVLYPGFELDELCAYPVALGRYLDATGDQSVLDVPAVREGLDRFWTELLAHRHPSVPLFDTFLYPSDDPATYPYLTYDNALVCRALEIYARVKAGLAERLRSEGQPRLAGPAEEAASQARRLAEAVRAAVREHLVVEGPFGPMFAWSTDLEGAHKVYDEPPGSLQLLAYYGFCSPDDPTFLNTVRWVHSEHNPYAYQGRFPEVGCPHSTHPFVMGLFNSLLCGVPERRQAALATLRDLGRAGGLDGGLACEAFDRETGRVRTGAAFATCAGFLAYALVRAAGDSLLGGPSGQEVEDTRHGRT